MSLRGIEGFREWVNREQPDDRTYRLMVETILDLATVSPLLWSWPVHQPDGGPEGRVIPILGTAAPVLVLYQHTNTGEYPGPIDVMTIAGSGR